MKIWWFTLCDTNTDEMENSGVRQGCVMYLSYLTLEFLVTNKIRNRRRGRRRKVKRKSYQYKRNV